MNLSLEYDVTLVTQSSLDKLHWLKKVKMLQKLNNKCLQTKVKKNTKVLICFSGEKGRENVLGKFSHPKFCHSCNKSVFKHKVFAKCLQYTTYPPCDHNQVPESINLQKAQVKTRSSKFQKY